LTPAHQTAGVQVSKQTPRPKSGQLLPVGDVRSRSDIDRDDKGQTWCRTSAGVIVRSPSDITDGDAAESRATSLQTL
jgi:hypothetical protein